MWPISINAIKAPLTGRTTSALVMTAGLLASAGCGASPANEQAQEEASQTIATAPDDRCDQDLMLETTEYRAESLDRAVALADEVIEAKVLDLGTSTQRSEDDHGGATTSYTVTVQVIKALKGAAAPDTKLTSAVALDIENDNGEVVTRIGDHRLDSLAPGNQVILFISSDPEGFVIQAPGPAVIKDDKVELGACDLKAAEQSNATTITAINGRDANSFRSAIAEAQR